MSEAETEIGLKVSPEQPAFDALLEGRDSSAGEFRRRNSQFDTVSVHRADTAEYVDKGWEVRRRGKKTNSLRRPKTHHASLEDRAWCLLYRMGYPDIGSKHFVINFTRGNGSKGTKQIDAFAADPDTCIVVECKSRENRGKRDLRQDILETAALQEYIRSSVFRHYTTKPKIVWIYATTRIIWSDADLARANDAGIYVITDNELTYFETFIRHMGPAGRYQILGELLSGQRISSDPPGKIPAIRGKLGGYTFYSFVTTPRNLLRIAFVNHQALSHPDGAPAYQRMISSTRIKAIGQFIKDGGFFPTNLLANFNETPKFELLSNKDNTDENIKFGWLTLPNKYRSAWIIDGQHRLYGYSGLEDKHLDQSVSVIAFAGMAKAKEADLFISINHKQKSVPPGLLVSLLADLKLGDADSKTALSALASATVRTVNLDKTSALFQRFRQTDVPPNETQNLTISEVVKGINRSQLLGKIAFKAVAPGPLSGETDGETIERARRILNGYFDAVRSANPARWDAGAHAYVCVNPAVRAHLMLIPEVMSYVSHKKGVDFMLMPADDVVRHLVAVIAPVLEFLKVASDDDVKQRFSRKFGEGGVKDYLFELSKLISNDSPDFGSDEFKRTMEQRASDTIAEANKDILSIAELLTDVVIGTLKAVHGTHTLDSGDLAYWELGIAKASMKEKAHARQQGEPLERRKRKEAYLDLIDMKEIVEQPNNWPHFQVMLSYASPGEKKSGKHTQWIARFNDIRKIAAHKNSLRTYTDEDLEFLDWLRSEVHPSLLAANKAI